jgi:hypothetical protein
MNLVAVSAISKCYSILGMDTSSLRHEWAQRIGESLRLTLRRRRAMLQKAGCHLSAQYQAWDELRREVRDALGAE